MLQPKELPAQGGQHDCTAGSALGIEPIHLFL